MRLQSHDDICFKILPTLLEVYSRYIFYYQKEAFFEDKYDQIKELQNKRNILKNLEFHSRQ